FDLLVVDAPCSGSGMFHKDHAAIDEWSLANVKLCSERQKRILAHSLDSLTQDGYLFYSTCSYSKEENEDIVDWLIDEWGMAPLSLSVDEAWGIDQTQSPLHGAHGDRKSTRLNSSHVKISYAVFCLKKKKRPFSTLVRPTHAVRH